jgi:hypothetical protein
MDPLIKENKESNNEIPFNIEEEQNFPATIVIKDLNGNYLKADVTFFF